MTDPSSLTGMDSLREAIDGIDRDLVTLLARRAACIDRAVELKRASGLPARIDWRVDQVIGNAQATATEAGLDPELARALWSLIVEWSIEREARALSEDLR